METLLRATDVAAILNVRPTTVYALAARGVLAHVRIAQGQRRGLIRFRPADVERLIRERRVESTH